RYEPASGGLYARRHRLRRGQGRMMTSELARSYDYCDRLARREAGNFYNAFRVLPRQQRLATCALYAFLRIADDLSDEPGALEAKRARLVAWRQGLRRALEGADSHPLHG